MYKTNIKLKIFNRFITIIDNLYIPWTCLYCQNSLHKPLHVDIIMVYARRYVVPHKVPHHVHVTCTTEVHKPPIGHILKRVIRRLADMEQRLCTEVVFDGLCILDAC